MHKDLKKLVAAERRHQRELKQLRDLRSRAAVLKHPDPKLLALIDAEINHYLEPK